jgi:hypothetical protein
MIANLSGTPSRFCQKSIGSSSTTLYTAQPDGRSVILDIMVVNTTSAPVNLTMYIGSVATANAFGWYSSSIPAYSSMQYSGYQILNQSEALLAVGSATGLSVTISGIERV